MSGRPTVSSETHDHAHQFDTQSQQQEAAFLGMWAFLATEVLFFGALFAAYVVNRWRYPEIWDQASQALSITLGFINTLVLLVSSLTMALAVHAAQTGKQKQILGYLVVTILLACTFL